MNVVDSSGWLEYFADGLNADFFAQAIEAVTDLVVPTLSLYEVLKRVLQQRGEGDALQAVAVMIQGNVIERICAKSLSFLRRSPRYRSPEETCGEVKRYGCTMMVAAMPWPSGPPWGMQ